MTLLLLNVSAHLLSLVPSDGSDNSIYTRPQHPISHVGATLQVPPNQTTLTLLSDDSISSTLCKVLGLSSLDLGFTGIVSFFTVLGEDGGFGRSSDGLVLRGWVRG